MPNSGSSDGSGQLSRVSRRSVLKYGGASSLAALAGCLGDGDDGGDGNGGNGNGGNGNGGGTGNGGDGDPITIGALAPLILDMGISGQRGAEIAVDELNANGGVLGREVDLVVKDTEADSASASTEVNDLINNEEADLIAGGYSSEVVLGIIDRIADEGVPFFNAGSTAPDVNTQFIGQDYDAYKNNFMQVPNQNMQLPLHGEYAGYLNDLHGWDTAAVIVEDASWTRPISDRADSLLGDQGIDVAMNERFALDTSDYSPLLDRAEENDVDFVLKYLALTDGTGMLSTWSNNEYPFGMEGINGASYAVEYWEDSNQHCEYEATITPGPTGFGPVTDKTTTFTETYQEEYSDRPSLPIYMAFYMYDAIMVWAEAVEAAGTADYANDLDDIVDEIVSNEYTGTSGTIDYQGPDGEYPHTVDIGEDAVPIITGQWRSTDDGGTQELVWPESVRTADHEVPPWM